MAFSKDSKGFQQLLQLNTEQVKFLKGFLEGKGRRVKIPDTMRSKGSNISLYLCDNPRNMEGASVKVDLWVNKTGNVFVEDYHNRRDKMGKVKKEKGWYHTCFAQHLFVIDPIGFKVYQFNWRLLKALVAQKGPEIEHKRFVNKTDAETDTAGYLVKLDILRDNGILTAEWDIE